MSETTVAPPDDRGATQSYRTGSEFAPVGPLHEPCPGDCRRPGYGWFCEKQQFKKCIFEAIADVCGSLANMIAAVGLGKTERVAERFGGLHVIDEKEDVIELHGERLSKALSDYKLDASGTCGGAMMQN